MSEKPDIARIKDVVDELLTDYEKSVREYSDFMRDWRERNPPVTRHALPEGPPAPERAGEAG